VSDLDLPSGRMQPIGYVVLQHAIRGDRPVKAYERWMNRIPAGYSSYIEEADGPGPSSPSHDSNCLALLKHYRSLMPMAMEARKPIFHLKPSDGAIGAHATAVRDCFEDFRLLAERIRSSVADATPPPR
jgi:hypothetical protein